VSISRNGYRNRTSALADSGANGFIFIDTQYASNLAKYFQTKIVRLKHPCPVKGYDGRAGTPITHVIILDLNVQGHRETNVPMLMLDIGRHDVILGRQWFEKHQILLDIAARRLIWPENIPSRSETLALPSSGNQFQHQVTVPRYILRRTREVALEHQLDIERRDKLMKKEDIYLSSLNSPDCARKIEQRKHIQTRIKRRSEKWDRLSASCRTNKELENDNKATTPFSNAEPADKPPHPSSPKQEPVMQAPQSDIALIGAVGFKWHVRKKDTETFITSFYEIDRAIQEKYARKRFQDDLDNIELVKKCLPRQYRDYEDVFSKAASDELAPHRPIDHKIVLEEAPDVGFCPLYKLSLEELEAMKKYLAENLQKGFIIPSQSPYASPILFARKGDGGLRFCVDYRKLNALTKKDRYPLPLIEETLERLAGAKIFTKVDIRQAFHRIRIHPDSEDLTTFRTRYGAYKYKVLPFGLTNGPATFQRYVNDLFLDYIDQFMTVYLDDILIFSKNKKEHEEQVKKVLERLRKAGLQADIRKSEFHVTRTKYLGFIVSTDGIAVDPEKIEAIKNWGVPTTVQGIQSFLGFCNFYRIFIREYGRIARPLNRLTHKDTSWNFDENCQQAFQALKNALVSAPILTHFTPGRATRLETDASDGVVGGVLTQRAEDNLWHPVAFFSKTMAPAEMNYPIHDKEMLAIIRALEQWRPELQGVGQFDIYTDHRALEYFMTTKKLSARQANWAEYLSQFQFLIRFRPGRKNELADALTRKDEDLKHYSVLKDWARTTAMLKPDNLDEEIKRELSEKIELSPVETQESLFLMEKLLKANRLDESLEAKRKESVAESSPYSLDGGLLLYQGRLVIPTVDNLRTELLNEIHQQPSTAHPGRNKMRRLLQERYYWPGMFEDVARYVRNCHACRRANPPRDKAPGLLQPLSIPERPWQHISVDFQELPKDKHGYNAVLVFVDRLSKRPISIPCKKETDARATARLFLTHIYCVHGAPDTIVSDRGPQFISDFWNEFCTIIGTKLKLSTAYHAQTDGQTEIVNQHIQQRLRPYVNYHQDDWSEYLPMIDFAAALLPSESTGLSPFMVEYGFEPRVSFDWTPYVKPSTVRERLNRQDAQKMARRMNAVWDQARKSMQKAQSQQKQQADRHRRGIDFDVGDSVWVTMKNWKTGRPSKKLDHQQAGPYRILEKIGNSFKLDLPGTIRVRPVFSPDKLRRAADDPLPGQHQEPPPAIEVNGEQEYEVERILASRWNRSKLEYRVKWTGYDDDPAWYSAENFTNAPEKIQEYHAAYPNKPGPN
jgi:RNase H-like domain found in reverse transcriptase/Reverse transcriptase (RNA-dependent DNA polymerase)/Integrase zinc binding domain/Integrase core domain/Chromo (CHRromatin Organisation MOdifier) domain